MKIIDRETAAQLGLKRFFTGVPCRKGHICERGVSNYGCVECHRLERHNPEWVRLRKAFFKQKGGERDPERVRQQWREWSARQKKTRRAAAEMETARSVSS